MSSGINAQFCAYCAHSTGNDKKGWMTGMNHLHVDPPLILLIKETHDDKSDKYFVKLKLRRYPKSSMSDLYEFKISSFDNYKPEA